MVMEERWVRGSFGRTEMVSLTVGSCQGRVSIRQGIHTRLKAQGESRCAALGGQCLCWLSQLHIDLSFSGRRLPEHSLVFQILNPTLMSVQF